MNDVLEKLVFLAQASMASWVENLTDDPMSALVNHIADFREELRQGEMALAMSESSLARVEAQITEIEAQIRFHEGYTGDEINEDVALKHAGDIVSLETSLKEKRHEYEEAAALSAKLEAVVDVVKKRLSYLVKANGQIGLKRQVGAQMSILRSIAQEEDEANLLQAHADLQIDVETVRLEVAGIKVPGANTDNTAAQAKLAELRAQKEKTQ